MTAFELIQEYMQETGELPPEGNEYEEISFYARELRQDIKGVAVDVPEASDVVSVCQMLRQAAQEAAGQGRLF